VRLTSGWKEFVAAEKIVASDLGVFFMVAPMKLEMKLFSVCGVRKPMSMRPLLWNREVAYAGNEDDIDDAPVGNQDEANHVGELRFSFYSFMVLIVAVE
jgi:hypothetical protein